jgi:hypothetical protein
MLRFQMLVMGKRLSMPAARGPRGIEYRPRTIRALGAAEHVWFWKGHEVRERAWLFLADQSVDPRLEQGESPDLVEPDGDRFKTLWRSMHDSRAALPKTATEPGQVHSITE